MTSNIDEMVKQVLSVLNDADINLVRELCQECRTADEVIEYYSKTQYRIPSKPKAKQAEEPNEKRQYTYKKNFQYNNYKKQDKTAPKQKKPKAFAGKASTGATWGTLVIDEEVKPAVVEKPKEVQKELNPQFHPKAMSHPTAPSIDDEPYEEESKQENVVKEETITPVIVEEKPAPVVEEKPKKVAVPERSKSPKKFTVLRLPEELSTIKASVYMFGQFTKSQKPSRHSSSSSIKRESSNPEEMPVEATAAEPRRVVRKVRKQATPPPAAAEPQPQPQPQPVNTFQQGQVDNMNGYGYPPMQQPFNFMPPFAPPMGYNLQPFIPPQGPIYDCYIEYCKNLQAFNEFCEQQKTLAQGPPGFAGQPQMQSYESAMKGQQLYYQMMGSYSTLALMMGKPQQGMNYPQGQFGAQQQTMNYPQQQNPQAMNYPPFAPQFNPQQQPPQAMNYPQFAPQFNPQPQNQQDMNYH